MQGSSFLPIVEKPNVKGRAALYYHYYENGEHSVSPHFGIKTARFKLIRFYKRVESWELFDLENDPNELNNLYENREYKGTIKLMKRKLKKLLQTYEDEQALEILNRKL